MSTGTKNAAAWVAAALTALAMAGGMALFAARSAAAGEVRPVESRVSRLEAQQEQTAKQLDKIDRKLDVVLDRVSSGHRNNGQ